MMILSLSLLCFGCDSVPPTTGGGDSVDTPADTGPDYGWADEGPTEAPEGIIGWEETSVEEEVSFGDVYVLDFYAQDYDGSLYFCTTLVKDSRGNKVVTLMSQFYIEDANGYTISYRIVVDGEDKVKEVTLKVVDKTDPEVLTPNLHTAFVGELYRLPSVTVTDNVDGNITPTLSVYKKGSTTPITLTNNAFTPTELGMYELRVQASDRAGNTIDKKFEFAVRENAPVNVLENFDVEASLVNSLNGDSDSQEWLSEFQGKQGVLHVKSSGVEKQFFFFKFMRDASAYTNVPFDYITIRMYAVNNNAEPLPSIDCYQTTSDGMPNAEVEDPENPGQMVEICEDWIGVDTGKWVDLTITNFGDWNTFFSEATGPNGTQLFWHWSRYTDVYIDQITCYKAPVDEETGNFVESFSSAEDVGQVKYFVDGTGAGTTEWLETFEGRNGVIKVDDAEQAYGYFIKASTSYETLVASNWQQMEINIYIPSASLNAEKGGEAWLRWGVHVDASENPINPSAAWVTNMWNQIIIRRADLADDEAFMQALTGKGAHLFSIWDCNAIYIDSITVDGEIIGEARDEETGNFVESFSLTTDVNRATANTSGSSVFKDVFQGKEGVIEVSDNAEGMGYVVSVSTTYESLVAKNWDRLYVNIYIPSVSLTGEELAWLQWGTDVDANQNPINTANGWVTDAWSSVVIEKSALADPDAFMQALTGNGAHLFFIWGCEEIYFDSITFEVGEYTGGEHGNGALGNGGENGGDNGGTQDPQPETLSLVEGFDTSATGVKFGYDALQSGTATYVASYQGRNGVVKMNDAETDKGYNFKVSMSYEDLVATNWTRLHFNIYIPSASVNEEQGGAWLVWGTNVADVAINTTASWTMDAWSTLTILRSDLANADDFMWAITNNGAHIFYIWGCNEIYIDSISYDTAEPTEIEAFSTATDANKIKFGYIGEGEGSVMFYDSYQDKTGVVKVNDNQLGGDGGYFVKVGMTKAELEATSWNKIYINVYIPTASLSVPEDGAWLGWGLNTYPDTPINDLEGWTLDAWTTIVIDRYTLPDLDGFMTALTGDGAHLFYVWGCGDVYIDSITYM